MRRAFTLALVLAAVAPAHRAWADEDEAGDDEGSDEEEAASAADEEAAEEEEEETDEDAGLRPKQNLTGHDDGTNKRSNEFERDRFFVDKVDTEKTENGTLVQGSIASSSFLYAERGAAYPNPAPGMPGMTGDNSGSMRAFTELRLQTDFRHIAASRWDARIDGRVRAVNSIAPSTNGTLTDPNRVQSGLFGQNEYELREMWLIRSGKRSDVFLGRQFVPDLGGIKFDGLRVDYAKSAKLTIIGFGGLYPLRGSRSITTDYQPLKSEQGNAAGRFVATGGGGAAYRSVNSYGAIGAVVIAPLKVEQPRLYVTSQGYMRSGPKLDIYHFALVDLLGSAASDSSTHIQLTNISAGVNYKPSQRLRLTASANQVDTETLSVQAGQFLNGVDTMGAGNTAVQNEAYIYRIATRSVRGGVSAGLGHQQRFEISTALTYRQRPEFTLTTPDAATPDVTIPAASSAEVWGSIVDRRSVAGLRLGIDGSRSFGVGTVAYQRSELLLVRLSALRSFANGRGEWETEASYTDVKDSTIGQNLTCTGVADCYGTSNNKLYSLGGQATYRLKTDWLGIATLYLLRINNTRSDGVVDPPVVGITGFIRIAKRF